jgi:hypothetical protein
MFAGSYRLAKRPIQQLASDLFGLDISLGMIPLPIAGAVLVAGLRRGRRRVYLLTDGSAAEATLKICQSLHSQSRPRPFSVWRNRWESFRAPGDNLPIDPEALTPEQRLAKGTVAAMGCLSTPLFVFGIIVLVLGLGLAIFGKEPMRINGQPVSRGWASSSSRPS